MKAGRLGTSWVRRIQLYAPAKKTVMPRSNGLHPDLKTSTRLRMNGIQLLSVLPENSSPAVFLEPQCRGLLDKMKYGNEGEKRGRRRTSLRQMSEDNIAASIMETDRVLGPSVHLFLWVDKFHLCQGISDWLAGTTVAIVDMIAWNKKLMGMGCRTRRSAEYLLVLQQRPTKAKGVWKTHDIRDVWEEKVKRCSSHAHRKPVELQKRLNSAVSSEGDIVMDPAAGSFSVMEAADSVGRNFLGCDIIG